MNEEWRDVVNYEGYYQVSNLGNVRSLDRIVIGINRTYHLKGKKLQKIVQANKVSKIPGKNLYEKVMLHKAGSIRVMKVHRLVARAFLEDDPMRPQVNHKDGNGLNNNVSNLEWCTNRENQIHAWKVLGRTSIQEGRQGVHTPASIPIKQLDKEGNLIEEWASAISACRAGGYMPYGISHVLKGRQKTHKGYRWEYA